MKILFQSIVLAIMLCATYIANAAPVKTLQEYVEKAVTTNPEVQARFHNYKSAAQEQNVAKGALLPHLDVNSTYRRYDGADLNSSEQGLPDRQTQLVLRQLLFDGFITRNEVKRLDHAKQVRYYELLSGMQSTAFEVVRTYIDLLRYKKLVAYAEDNYIAHKLFFDRIEERFTAGVGRRVDLDQASGRMALAEANLLTEVTNLHDVTARFQRLVGELPGDDLQAVDFFKAGIPSTKKESLELAFKQNPELLAAIENIIATQQELNGRRGKYMPRLDLQARKGLDHSGESGSETADVLELTMSFNLFNGFSDRAGVNQIAEKLNSSADLRDKACVDIRQTVVIAYNDILRLKEQLVYRDQHQLAIEKAREAYRDQYDIGQRSLLDLLDTENEYFQARRAYTNTEMDLFTAYARTYTGQGDLLGKLNVARNDFPEVARKDYLDTENVCQTETPESMQIDKEDIVAKAKPYMQTLSVLKTPKLVDGQLQRQSSAVADSEAVSTRVRDWAAAWERKDFQAYSNFYSDHFTSEGILEKQVWLEQQRKKMSSSGKVKVALQNVKVTINGNSAITEFKQSIISPNGSLETDKELRWEKVENRWVIVRELTK